MKGSLIIVAFFAAGILCGRADVLPQWVSSSTVSMTALCALLLCVGMGIGSNPDMKSEFRSLNPRRWPPSWGRGRALPLPSWCCNAPLPIVLLSVVALPIIRCRASFLPNIAVSNWAP